MAKITRRGALGLMASAAPATALAQAPAQQTGVELHWLDGTAPALATGVSWGVPWPRGTVRRDQRFRLTAGGTALPLQSWPLAYWPDGSVKWTGFATVAGPRAQGPFVLSPGSVDLAGAPAVRVTEASAIIEINTGAMYCHIARKGEDLIGSMVVEDHEVARRGKLVCALEYEFVSEVKEVTVEQSGPVRAVVRIEGVHKAATRDAREWLPFVVRLYFYAGQQAVRMIHTVVFDGDEQKDFIHGLGVAFEVPMYQQPHNRHVRFSGEGTGLWAEPIQPLTGRRNLPSTGGVNHYADQLAGKRVPEKESFSDASQKLLSDWAVWSDFKLVQSNADGFQIRKRAHPQCCWIDAGAGRRASGLVFAGSVSGGLGVAVRNFWQSHPGSLEVRNAVGDYAEVRAWLWSPDAQPMDLRHYDVRAHDLDSSYEDVQPGFSTPHGIARTSEIMLYPSGNVPARETTVEQARLAGSPPLLVTTPQYLHSTRVFGIWSLPDRSTETKRGIEERLDSAVAHYQKEVEQRHWYGFWDFGDVMHAYDPGRHTWRYDIGGFAWDNTELGTDLWLWYSFLRTGRADIFRMAEAMTRHTSEVDCYHLGRFNMLGSRHNVRHWGCGAKELRISQAAYRRYFYYLTTDERTGDLMRAVVDADSTLTKLDPMRIARPLSEMPSSYPARIRGGPDWLAIVGNWMTEWERSGGVRYRDKILAGMDSIAGFPYGFLSGPENLYGYDPANGKLYTLVADPFGTYNLVTNMGGAEVMFELNELIDHEGWQKTWLQYCRLTGAPKEVVARDRSTGAEGADASYAGGGRLAAYVYQRTKNAAFARRALAQLGGRGALAIRRVDGPAVLNPLDEAPGISTNTIAQSSLQAIQILAMCGDQID